MSQTDKKHKLETERRKKWLKKSPDIKIKEHKTQKFLLIIQELIKQIKRNQQLKIKH